MNRSYIINPCHIALWSEENPCGGRDAGIDGKIPVNTGGGLVAFGHPMGATGVKQVAELSISSSGVLTMDEAVVGAEVGGGHLPADVLLPVEDLYKLGGISSLYWARVGVIGAGPVGSGIAHGVMSSGTRECGISSRNLDPGRPPALHVG